ncbi:cytochrome C [bacterium]|nr:MAG: cytochrome C [bacterium]
MSHISGVQSAQSPLALRASGSRALLIAAVLLAVSLVLPWWHMTMYAPQYPAGLSASAGVFSIHGDVTEINELNHYIGFMPLEHVAPIERRAGIVLGPLIVLLALAAAFLGGPWRLLATPAVVLPVFTVADLAGWLWYAGNHLDPHAALSTSVAPWTPHMLGPGGVGQFHTFAMFDPGFALAVAAAVLVVSALRRRHRPAVGQR